MAPPILNRLVPLVVNPDERAADFLRRKPAALLSRDDPTPPGENSGGGGGGGAIINPPPPPPASGCGVYALGGGAAAGAALGGAGAGAGARFGLGIDLRHWVVLPEVMGNAPGSPGFAPTKMVGFCFCGTSGLALAIVDHLFDVLNNTPLTRAIHNIFNLI